MGSRYRCRVSPSGVPGCVPGTAGTGGTGEGTGAWQYAERSVSGLVVSPGLPDDDIFSGVGGPIVVSVLDAPTARAAAIWFTASRNNADPAGSGQYQIMLNGVPAGGTFSESLNSEHTVAIVDLAGVLVDGPLEITVRLTAVTDDETISFGRLLVHGLDAV